MIGEEETVHTSRPLQIERRVGVAHGVAVEVMTCAETRRVMLVVSPTVHGISVLAEGDLDEAEVFARVGACVLQALKDVVPLATGDAFRFPVQRGATAMSVDVPPSGVEAKTKDLRQ